jgi:hypothetical protein
LVIKTGSLSSHANATVPRVTLRIVILLCTMTRLETIQTIPS